MHRRLTIGGRIAVCGQISTYNAEGPIAAGVNPRLLIVFRARMEGFLVSDYVHRFAEAERAARPLARRRAAPLPEDVTEGLENAPRAFIGMLRGENRGKALVKVGDGQEGLARYG